MCFEKAEDFYKLTFDFELFDFLSFNVCSLKNSFDGISLFETDFHGYFQANEILEEEEEVHNEDMFEITRLEEENDYSSRLDIIIFLM